MCQLVAALLLLLALLCAMRHSVGKSEMEISSMQLSARIVGGTTATISQFPYLVNLRLNGRFMCGGSLVTTKHVVTAAHCVHGESAKSFVVVGGATLLSEPGVRRSVSRIITPKTYRANVYHMDVAVLKLNSAMTGRNIATINLCSATMYSGDHIQVSGWGLTGERAENDGGRLRTAKIRVIAKKSCMRDYANRARLTSTMFCAAEPDVDSCSGDSGGPAVYKNHLCGIVSWGIGCARKSSPGVYTKVTAVKKFIQNALSV